MGRLLCGALGLLALGAGAGCGTQYDCQDSCSLLRDCGLLVGTSRETCEVRCSRNEDDHEAAIDACGECVDSNSCSSGCVEQCVCALSMDPAEYAGVICGP
jgi:hypothetical protein